MNAGASRGIRTGSAAALIAGNMIGAGVFTTSGFALADLGDRRWVLAAWAVGGGVALCGALSYARLSARMPINGGEYLLLSRALHPAVGFLAGWVSLLAGFTAPIAVAAHGLEAYLADSFGIAWPAGVVGSLAIGIAGLVHGLARGAGLVVQDVAVTAKVLAILLFVALGAVAIGGGSPERAVSDEALRAAGSDPSWGAFAITLVWISFAFSGWNAAVYVAGELEEPERTLRRASGLATIGVTVLYLALNAVFVYAAPVGALAGRPDVGAVAAEAIGGPVARRALSAIVALGLATSISAMVMVGPRVYAQMARDGVLPPFLAGGAETPRAAIGLQVALAWAAFGLAGLRELLSYTGFLLGLCAAATVLCLFVGSDAEEGRSWRGHPWIPLVFVGVTLWSSAFVVVRQPWEALAGVGTLAVGGLVYGLSRRRRRRLEDGGPGRSRPGPPLGRG